MGLLVALWMAGDRAAGVDIAVDSVVPPRPALDLAGVGPSRPLLARRTGEGAAVSAEHVASHLEAAEASYTVRVRYKDSGEAAPGYVVEIAEVAIEETGDERSASGHTGPDGQFRASLAKDAAFLEVDVRSAPTHALVARWLGLPRDVIDIAIPPPWMAYCRVQFGARFVVPPASDCGITLYSRGLDRLFQGGGELNEDYRVVLPVHLPSDHPAVEVVLAVSGQVLASRTFPASRLLEPPGPVLQVDATVLELTITDAAGVPVAGAEARAAGAETEGVLPVARTLSDARGAARLVLPPGRGELCVGHPGFAAHLLAIDVPGPPLLVRLSPIDLARRMTVEVLSPRASPVENAIVTIAPDAASDECAYAAYVQQKTDRDGHAAFPIHHAGPLSVRAYHPDFGISPRAVVEAAGGSRVTIRMEETCDLLVHPLHAGRPLDVGLPVYWMVLDRQRDRGWDGRLRAPWRVLDDLPVGDLIVSLYVPGEGLYALEPVHVAAPGEYELEAHLRPGRFLEGRVVAREGGSPVGLEVVAHGEEIPPAVAERWCRGAVDPGGFFAVFAPLTGEVRIEVLAGGSVRASFPGIDPRETVVLSLR
ncbi:MAG: hypothetical protein AB1726_07910 [Planctomycetota bacterium]